MAHGHSVSCPRQTVPFFVVRTADWGVDGTAEQCRLTPDTQDRREIPSTETGRGRQWSLLVRVTGKNQPADGKSIGPVYSLKNQKIFKIFYQIESLNVCIEH